MRASWYYQAVLAFWLLLMQISNADVQESPGMGTIAFITQNMPTENVSFAGRNMISAI
jgi:hypothetical protein